MRVCNLSSGSDGNLTFIETAHNKFLIDCGLSCAETIKRLELLNVKPYEISGIFVSHEHSDHIKGINVFARKYGCKIYAHEKLWEVLESKLIKVNPTQFKVFGDADFDIEDLHISTIALPHDSHYCNGYTFNESSKKISIITDLGHTNLQILNHIKESRLIYLESNHDTEMLRNNVNYSASLKMRILGNNGHLSNIQCAKALKEIAGNTEKQIMLSHLSRENNTPKLAYNDVCNLLAENNIDIENQIKIGITSINPSSLFKIN